jgi:murein DD-endopeptidase MepM/ murein hydrolase activator NlpD
MKKVKILILFFVLSISSLSVGFTFKTNKVPNNYYQVYLDNEVLGVIKSKKKLEDYIDKRGDYYKKKYKVKKVYAPNGIEIKKLVTYNDKVLSVREVYKKIEKKKPFTIRGYKFEIKDGKKKNTIYTTRESIFKDSVTDTIKTFVGTDSYEKYKNKTQGKINTTGRIIENIYLDNDISIKSDNISVEEKIYTDKTSLTNYLLYGSNTNKKTYTIDTGDTIETVAFKNKVSTEEFLISNPSFNSANSLLFPGQQVVIEETNPQIKVVVEEHVVQDVKSSYKTEIKYNSSIVRGDEKVIQEGVDGLERVTQEEKRVNGTLVYVDPKSKQELTPSVSKIIEKGDKYVPTVGSKSNWAWPTNSGYTISSGYVYRINPVSGAREIHAAIDISGTGYGSPIYAATNGVVSESSYRYQDGNYVCINHNNGYYTCYAHMARKAVAAGQTVDRGQIIGYVGQSGWATGPHLHYEVWIGKPWSGGHRINPQTMY